jgi:uncharacterized protein YxeA
MNKTPVIVILTVLLAAVAGYFILNKKPKATPEAEQAFYLENTDKVTKIFMADKGGKKVLLEKKDGVWMVNGKYKAYKAKINMLLETMRRIRVDYPVTERMYNNVIKELATTSTKVEIYENNNTTPSKVYFVGGETLDGLGTPMIMEINGKIASKPYVVHIPGFNGSVNPRYFLDEKDWRSTTVFDYQIDDIKEVSLQWSYAPEQSFTLVRNNRNGFDMLENTENLPLFTTGVNQYLNSFSYINAESIENDNPKKEYVLTTEKPFLKMRVVPLKGNAVEMEVYKMEVTQRSKTQFDANGNPVKYDVDRYWAVVNNDLGFVVIQEFVFGKLFRIKDDFLPKKS